MQQRTPSSPSALRNAPERQRARVLEHDDELKRLLKAASETRYATRNRAVVLLAFDAGIRAQEIVRLRRQDVVDDAGAVHDLLVLDENICKRTPGRTVPLPAGSRLRVALAALTATEPGPSDAPLIRSERSEEPPRPMRADSIAYLFYRLFRRAGLHGCSSFSGRRTFIVRSMAHTPAQGGTLREAYERAGLRSLGTSEPYADVRPEPSGRTRQLRLF